MKSKLQRLTVGFLVLALLGTVAVTVQAANNQEDWSSSEWGQFWGNVAGEFMEHLVNAAHKNTLHFNLSKFKYIWYESADPLDNNSEVYFSFEMGNKERRLPSQDTYWSVAPLEVIYPDYYEDEVTFTVPAYQGDYRILAKVWDYDPVSTDDLLGRYIIRYNQYTDNSTVVRSSSQRHTTFWYSVNLD